MSEGETFISNAVEDLRLALRAGPPASPVRSASQSVLKFIGKDLKSAGALAAVEDYVVCIAVASSSSSPAIDTCSRIVPSILEGEQHGRPRHACAAFLVNLTGRGLLAHLHLRSRLENICWLQGVD